MTSELQEQIFKNSFVDEIRESMKFNQESYVELCGLLQKLALELKEVELINKDLVLYLYSMPSTVRNSFLSFQSAEDMPEIAYQLEDAWMELDELVTDCFIN